MAENEAPEKINNITELRVENIKGKDGNGTVDLRNDLFIADGNNIILDSTNGTQFGTLGTHKMGFYGKTPIALQTGVAVTDVAIHAALVNLGFITA